MAKSGTAWRFSAAAALAVAFLLVAALASQAAFNLNLVSKASNGDPAADGNSYLRSNGGSLSGDGKIAVFQSDSSNLPRGDGSTDRIYVRNLQTGKTRLVSVKSNGKPATGETQNPSISANGRYVGFSGSGEGLPGSDPNISQVWVHDLKTHVTRLVSRDKDGDAASGGYSEYPSFSRDGRLVAFVSDATSLPGPAGDQVVYVRDMERGKTLVGSKTDGGDPAFADLYGQALSSDGRRLVFWSSDADLPHGDGSTEHVYVRDLETGNVELADRANDGEVADDDSADAAISASGGHVAYESDGSNLPGGAGTGRQVYLRDLGREKTILVSRNSSGEPMEGSADADFVHPSADGRYVAFRSNGGNLPGGDGITEQIYIRDMRQGETKLLSKNAGGDPGDDTSTDPSVSTDGAWVLFNSSATNLGGSSAGYDVFRAGPLG